MLCILTALTFFYFNTVDDTSNKNKPSFPIAIDQSIHKSENNPDTIKKHTVSSKSHDDYQNYSQCGFGLEAHYEKIKNFDINALDDSEIRAFEKMMDDCDKWFENLSTLNQKELETLKTSTLEKEKILTGLSAYEYDANIIDNAIQNVSHIDPEIAGTALLYLLSYDHAFLNKIGEGMNTSNIEFLRSNLNLAGLYSCEKGLDCSATSSLMSDLCLINETACGQTHSSWIRSQSTINQYDDLLHALQVVNSIIASDWLEKR